MVSFYEMYEKSHRKIPNFGMRPALQSVNLQLCGVWTVLNLVVIWTLMTPRTSSKRKFCCRLGIVCSLFSCCFSNEKGCLVFRRGFENVRKKESGSPSEVSLLKSVYVFIPPSVPYRPRPCGFHFVENHLSEIPPDLHTHHTV